MLHLLLPLLALVPADTPGLEPEHSRNPILRRALDDGPGASARLPAPAFLDDQPAEAQRAALRRVAGSSRALDEMTADSLTAPHVLRLRDTKAGAATIRSADLTFVLHADLASIDADGGFKSSGGGAVDVGNMKLDTRVLTADDLKGGPAAAPSSADEHYTHSTGRLLDRIAVESTDRVVRTRSADSLVFATETDARFGLDARWPNRWMPLTLQGAREMTGRPEPYAGGVGYMKISRYKPLPKALVVEAHFAFAEPLAWFDGDPVLRSKFGMVAQDQVRRLRRDLKKPGKG